MPILTVEIVGSSKCSARELAAVAASVLGEPVQRTWVKVFEIPSKYYSEEIAPVFVSVLLGRSLIEERKIIVARELARRFAEFIDRPVANVHILFEIEARGRMFFGGVNAV